MLNSILWERLAFILQDLSIMKENQGKPFIMFIMAEAKLERIERVSEMVKEYGTYPIDTA